MVRVLPGSRLKPQPTRATANLFGDYQSALTCRVRIFVLRLLEVLAHHDIVSQKSESEWWPEPAACHCLNTAEKPTILVLEEATSFLDASAESCTDTCTPHDTATPTDTVLRHGRDALPTWDSIAYWERGTKGPGSRFLSKSCRRATLKLLMMSDTF